MYKNIALNETKNEIKRNLEKVKKICSNLNDCDLLFCVYLLRISKNKKQQKIENLENIEIDRNIDNLKFMISCIYKYSNISKVDEFNYKINNNAFEHLFEISEKIHNLYERVHWITMMDKLELDNKKNFYTTNLVKEFENKKIEKNFRYIARFQETINREKKELLTIDELLEKFTLKYSEYDSILKEILGLNINEIAEKIKELIKISKGLVEKDLPYIDNVFYDLKECKTFSSITKSFIFDEKILFDIFGKNGMKFIRKITFKKSDFKPHELAFHYITRSPIFKIRNKYIIFPELLLDSLMDNFHYTLLENKQYSEKYKKIMSDLFVKQISEIGEKYGLKYFNSEVELYQGKNKLGDIDLILRDEKNGYELLIEAKNHTVPLPVYFGDNEQIEKRLNELEQTWEKKVEKRYKYLIENHKKINVNGNFKYIIVTKLPEILSHYSNYLVLSVNEFEFYLQNNAKFLDFNSLYNEFYLQEEFDFQKLKFFINEKLGFKIEK